MVTSSVSPLLVARHSRAHGDLQTLRSTMPESKLVEQAVGETGALPLISHRKPALGLVTATPAAKAGKGA